MNHLLREFRLAFAEWLLGAAMRAAPAGSDLQQSLARFVVSYVRREQGHQP